MTNETEPVNPLSRPMDLEAAVEAAKVQGRKDRWKKRNFGSPYPPNDISLEFGVFKGTTQDYLDVCDAYDDARDGRLDG